MRTLVGIILSATILTACGGSGGALNPATNTAAAQTASHRASSSGYQQLYAFKGTPDGASPLAGLIAVKGKLYGTTLNGSKNYCSASCNNGCYLGCGTVYSVNESGKEDVVYNFRGNLNSAEDGSWPFGPVTNVKGVMYGVTSSNGANSAGMIFSVTRSGKEANIYSFKGG
ncbi:MAG: choice-of-anchor tandem repeat GloVer-containing protein, partial [Candidatus Tumulicola sp.]